MAQEVQLKSGWLKADMERAAERVGEWKRAETVKTSSQSAANSSSQNTETSIKPK